MDPAGVAWEQAVGGLQGRLRWLLLEDREFRSNSILDAGPLPLWALILNFTTNAVGMNHYLIEETSRQIHLLWQTAKDSGQLSAA